MPRRPKHVERRGKTFYLRRQVNGTRRRWKLGKYLAEAKTLAARIEAELDHGGVAVLGPDPSKETVARFGERWLAERIATVRNPKGLRLATQRFQAHICPVLGSRPLERVGRADLFKLLSSLQTKGLKPQSVAHVLSDLRCLLRFAFEVEACSRIPSFARVLPRIPEEPPKHLNDDQCGRILSAARGGYRLAVELGLLTGMRWGELHRLQWREVRVEPKPHLVLAETKSGKVRRVPLVPEAVALLRGERARTSSVFVLPFRGKNPGAWVRGIRSRSGVPWHFHQLRHTFAFRWLRKGGSKEALRLILGHSTIRLTERYGRLGEDFVFGEVERIGLGVAPKWPLWVQEEAQG